MIPKAAFTRASFRATFAVADFSHCVGRLFTLCRPTFFACEVLEVARFTSRPTFLPSIDMSICPPTSGPTSHISVVKFRPMRAQQSPRNRKMAAISHGVCVWLHFWCCIYYLFSLVFFKYPYTCTCSVNTTCSMSFNPVLFAELLRKYERNVQSNNVIRQAQTTGSVRGSCKGDEAERNKKQKYNGRI